jgi:X-Pro dipeptidyl-peptidase
MSRRFVLASLCVPAALAVAFAARTVDAQPAASPVFVNGMAQIVPAWRDSTAWIRQDLWVETDFDSDRDGRKDRVHVDVTRPAQTDNGRKVPVLYGSSPYFAGTSRDDSNWDVRQELGDQPPTRRALAAPVHQPDRRRISNALVNDWVPRGFAVVHSSATGTGLSQGCATVGDYPERAPMKFVIDWLNGRAKGFTSPTSRQEVRATSWSTGKVGMIGTSYEGTLPLAAATTGVQGLEVVVPVSPNTSYYLYYRANGLVRSPGGYLGEDVDVLYDFVASGDPATRARCDTLWKTNVFAGPKGQDRATGDFNEFWKKRDLLPHVKNIKAAVLLAHGLNDYNVTPAHSVRIYDEMKRLGLPVSLYLHQGGHGGNPPADMLNRWFSHYLYGVDNGVRGEAEAWIVQDARAQAPAAKADAAPASAPAPNPRSRVATLPTPFASFPVPGTVPVTLYPTVGGRTIASLSYTRANTGTESFIDNVAFSGSALASAASSANRLLYATPVFRDTVHISGTPRVTLRLAANVKAANLSVWLVMLPYDSMSSGSQSYAGSVSHGWADLQNAKSLTKGGEYAAKTRGTPLTPGEYREVTFDLEPTDEFIPAGRQLAVMIMSSDREFTLWPKAGAELTIDLAKSQFVIPIVGGTAALQQAGMR